MDPRAEQVRSARTALPERTQPSFLCAATPAHPPKSAEKRAQERGTWFDMYPGRAAISPFADVHARSRPSTIPLKLRQKHLLRGC
jgi:hypothetical protein